MENEKLLSETVGGIKKSLYAGVEEIKKFNDVHDPKTGQFASKGGGTVGGYDTSVYKNIRQGKPPEKTLEAYKVFVLKDGKLYPPMVANGGALDTPVGVWLNAEEGVRAKNADGSDKTNTLGRYQVKAGGKGTQGGSGTLAYRPGWHLGELPIAEQFYTKDGMQKENFVWAKCKIAADKNYQEEAMSYGYNKNGKFQHSLAGLPKLPEDGYYTYRTNPNPNTKPWYITGAMKVERILTDAEVNKILSDNGLKAPQRRGGELTREKLADMGLTKLEFAKSFNDIRKSRFEEPEQESFKIAKADDDKREVFGWALVANRIDGSQIVDHQLDVVDPDELEHAAYEYVLNFRDTGEMHNAGMRKKGKLIESVVLTKEKQKAMGIPEGIVPEGWWVGFKITDDNAWQGIKNGRYRDFSIEGLGVREEMED